MPRDAVALPAAAVPRAGWTMPRDAGWWALLLPAFLLMSADLHRADPAGAGDLA